MKQRLKEAISTSILSDRKLLNIFLVITETTEFGQVEEIRHHVSSALNREGRSSAGS